MANPLKQRGKRADPAETPQGVLREMRRVYTEARRNMDDMQPQKVRALMHCLNSMINAMHKERDADLMEKLQEIEEALINGRS